MSTEAISTTDTSTTEEEEDWEYVEFDTLSEADMVGSEWLVGTCWDNNPNKIDETWCRLVRKEDGTNIAVWGDNSEGKWALDVATQYVTISKTAPWGKQIWACLVEDYYYLKGTVRGWTLWSAATCEAQWQARRLGVDPEEAGVAPWFEEEEEETEPEAIGATADTEVGETTAEVIGAFTAAMEVEEMTPEVVGVSTAMEVEETTPEVVVASTAMEVEETTPEIIGASTDTEVEETTPEVVVASTDTEVEETTPEVAGVSTDAEVEETTPAKDNWLPYQYGKVATGDQEKSS